MTDPKQNRLKQRLANLERTVSTDASVIASTHEFSQFDGSLLIGELIEFDPHNPNDYPKVGGIYVLYDISERPLYVGQGRSIDIRVKNHFDKFWFKSPIVESASYVHIDDRTLRERIEAVLIRFLKGNAIINKKLVDRR